jgi:acyl carrier protein
VHTDTERALVELAVDWVAANKLTAEAAEITEHTNLLESGLLDSFGFIELMLYLERQAGCRIDLTDVDPADFATVSGLCRIASLKTHP